MAATGLLVLRLALGVVIGAHGAHILFGAFAGPAVGPGGLDATAARFTAMGLAPAFTLAVASGVLQLAGAIAIGAGIFTRLGAAAALIPVAFAVWREYLPWGFFLNWTGVSGRGHGLEFAIVIAAGLVCLLLSGPGEFSVDGLRATTAARRAAGRARLRAR
jgi:putative oxidoreductase